MTYAEAFRTALRELGVPEELIIRGVEVAKMRISPPTRELNEQEARETIEEIKERFALFHSMPLEQLRAVEKAMDAGTKKFNERN